VNYREALAWLYSLQRFGIKLGLENIRRLIDELHVDLAGARVIHVAGTNGKGSVCAMIDSICRAQKYRTGLFTSPHLITFRERIRVNGEMISEEAVVAALTKIRDLVAAWEPHPTFFEITTALALQYFAAAKIDIAILETGMGGRLDATNAVQSNVAVITPIDFDHEKWLGDSLVKIATEKAGIIKPKVTVVSSPQKKDVEVVLQKRAAESGGPIEFVTEPHEQHPIALTGAQQKQNAALSVAAIRAGKIDIDDLAIARGLSSVDWPARFQRWDEHTIIDGAHNPAAAHTLVETWREMVGDQRATLILAILSDKDLHGICEALVPITDHAVLPRIRSERAANPQELAKILINLGIRCQICSTLADALEKARARNESILVTGSLHFAGEALAYLQGKPAAFEECAQ
jgi:dihydrofolate synthase/folylpolyglutamate synthase